MYVLSPVAKEDDIILGEYSNGMPAVIMRKSGKYPQIFCGGVDSRPNFIDMPAERRESIFTTTNTLPFAQTVRISHCRRQETAFTP